MGIEATRKPSTLAAMAPLAPWLAKIDAAPECFRLLAQTDPHSPSQFRVNGAVVDHPAFGPAVSPMNPKEKRGIW